MCVCVCVCVCVGVSVSEVWVEQSFIPATSRPYSGMVSLIIESHHLSAHPLKVHVYNVMVMG